MPQDLAAPAVKMNTRLGTEADVDPVDNPLVAASMDLVLKLRGGELTPLGFEQAVTELYDQLDVEALLKPWTEKALAEKKMQVLYRYARPGINEAMQMVYLDPHEVHPPHTHHNIISKQVVLNAPIYIREYDVLARLSPDELLLRLTTDRWFQPGEGMRTTETRNNAHWFAAGDKPAVLLNFRLYGYQNYTLNGPDTPLLRRLLDPTVGRHSDGLLIGREVGLEECYGKFAGKPVESFPIPG
ncbi:hypothetical protein ACFOD4_01575 [Pseudoroseomonas globiformis]|uniref:Uncharacterized protein n=1 Tax=Teichococcus globiformis TaxID=2307229 RepID=A0ABV7FWE6_9PROT